MLNNFCANQITRPLLFYLVNCVSQSRPLSRHRLASARCRLWVISGYGGLKAGCLLYPRKRISAGSVAMSAKCQKRTLATQRAGHPKPGWASQLDELLANQVIFARTRFETRVFPSDQIAPGTRWLAAITESTAVKIHSQSASDIASGGKNLTA